MGPVAEQSHGRREWAGHAGAHHSGGLTACPIRFEVVSGRWLPDSTRTPKTVALSCLVMTDLVIDQGDPTQPDVIRLLQSHLDHAREWSLPENVRVLDAARLADEGVRFLTARNQGRLVGIGALAPFEDRHAEIKSMHTLEEARERGVGRALLERLLGTAIEQECRRVSLETGTGDAFSPARRLYVRAGFKTCPPFGEYRRCPDSICMTRRLPAS